MKSELPKPAKKDKTNFQKIKNNFVFHKNRDAFYKNHPEKLEFHKTLINYNEKVVGILRFRDKPFYILYLGLRPEHQEVLDVILMQRDLAVKGFLPMKVMLRHLPHRSPAAIQRSVSRLRIVGLITGNPIRSKKQVEYDTIKYQSPLFGLFNKYDRSKRVVTDVNLNMKKQKPSSENQNVDISPIRNIKQELLTDKSLLKTGTSDLYVGFSEPIFKMNVVENSPKPYIVHPIKLPKFDTAKRRKNPRKIDLSFNLVLNTANRTVIDKWTKQKYVAVYQPQFDANKKRHGTKVNLVLIHADRLPECIGYYFIDQILYSDKNSIVTKTLDYKKPCLNDILLKSMDYYNKNLDAFKKAWEFVEGFRKNKFDEIDIMDPILFEALYQYFGG